LIGPKRYEAPWKTLENQGWIAEAVCHELRVPLDEKHKIIYSSSDQRVRFRLAATIYVGKTAVVQKPFGPARGGTHLGDWSIFGSAEGIGEGT
jgi:DNA excision repair protein ERCC-3